MPETKKRGRPRKYEDPNKRIRAFRQRKKSEGRRLDVYISTSASWRLTRLSEAWDCSLAQVIERLILEADQKYEGILFPET